jgi:hypothetical protein
VPQFATTRYTRREIRIVAASAVVIRHPLQLSKCILDIRQDAIQGMEAVMSFRNA